MQPAEIGKKYDKLASWWNEYHTDSNYGIAALNKALQFMQTGGQALDIGCGSGGRMVQVLDEHGFTVTGIDVSAEMIRIAKSNHIDHIFMLADICEFDSSHSFDFILAWDSIFHLPIERHQMVLAKMCKMLSPNGVMLYTLGNAVGSTESIWRDDIFSYSFIGAADNLRVLIDNYVNPIHLELDQYPENHVVMIGQKRV